MVTISLCMIIGNEAAHILRCLEAFAPTFDELSLVRALGSTKPDNTVELAGKWCHDHGKGFTFSEYLNGGSAQAWPHVDNFAEARNQSFKQASGEWLAWCDADDIIERPEALRKVIEGTKAEALFFPYQVLGTNKAPVRERLFRRSMWEKGRRWTLPVHENFKTKAEDMNEVFNLPRWVHAPLEQKPTSAGRNLRILGRQAKDLSALLFYLHQEFYLMHDVENARRYARAAMELPTLEESFRYEMLLNLGRMGSSPQEKLDYAAQAFGVMPHCREALVSLILCAFEGGDSEKAVVLSERLVATPEPPVNSRPWTQESKWYGSAGWDLRARALRRVGRHEEAGYAQAMAWQGRPAISLLHATTGNPQMAYQTRQAWMDAAAKPERVQYIMAAHKGDPDTLEFAKEFEHVECGMISEMLEEAALVSKGHLLVELIDNTAPSWGWDEELMNILKASGKDITTQPVTIRLGGGTEPLVCSRWRWQDSGRKFSQPWFVKAKEDGVLVEAPNIVLRPLDPRHKGKVWQTSTSPSSTPTSPTSAPSAMPAKPACMPAVQQPFTEFSTPSRSPISPLNSTVGMMTEPSPSTLTAPPSPPSRT